MSLLAAAAERGERLVGWIERTAPILIFSGLAFLGICLTLASTALHLDSVYFANPGKKLGYLNEINWSLNFSFVVPVAAFFAFASLNSAAQVIRNLSASKMLVRANGEPIKDKELLGRYQKMAGAAIRIAIVLCALSFVVSWREWLIDCLYGWDPTTKTIGTKDLLNGWNLAPTLAESRVSFGAMRAFGFFAFTLQAVAGAVFLIFCTMVVTFAVWIYHFTSERVGDELVPDVLSPDERRGFEHFEPFFWYRS